MLLVSLIGSPLTLTAGVAAVSSEPLAVATIQFEPSVVPFVKEKPPDEILQEELVLPEAFVQGNVLVINGKPYPIGDAFYDAEGIPLTSPARTVADAAQARTDPSSIIEAVSAALEQGLLSTDELLRAAGNRPRRVRDLLAELGLGPIEVMLVPLERPVSEKLHAYT